jgi:hypothetical protein
MAEPPGGAIDSSDGIETRPSGKSPLKSCFALTSVIDKTKLCCLYSSARTVPPWKAGVGAPCRRRHRSAVCHVLGM